MRRTIWGWERCAKYLRHQFNTGKIPHIPVIIPSGGPSSENMRNRLKPSCFVIEIVVTDDF